MLILALSIDSFILTKSFELSEAEAKALTAFPWMTSTLPLQRVNQRKAQFCSPKLFLGLLEEERRPWKKQRKCNASDGGRKNKNFVQTP